MTDPTPPTSTWTHPRRAPRAARSLAVVAVLAGAAAYAGFALFEPAGSTTVAGPSIVKTAAVKVGALTTTEKIDGSLELSSSLAVLHRIEGQTSNATASAGAGTTSAGTTGTGVKGAGTTGSGTKGGAAPAAGGSVGAGTSASALRADGVIAAITDVAGSRTQDGATPCTAPAATTSPSTTIVSPDDTAAAQTTTSTTATATATTIPTTDCATATVPATSVTSVPLPAPPAGGTTTIVGEPAPGITDTSTTLAGGPAGRARVGTGGSSGRTAAAGSGSTAGNSASSASSARVTQTVTSLISVGMTVGLGDVLYSVDSQPVVALSGALPAWRTLSTSSADGPDIQQLERSLVSLGYDPDGAVAVDDTFDAHTKAMVERWQTGLGIEATGSVPLGAVVFVPTSTTVSSVTAAIGDAVSDGDTILTLTAAAQDVVIDVPDGDETFIVPGLHVTLGSGTGIITQLRSIERSGAVVVQAVITPDAPITGVANGGTIKVTVTADVPGSGAGGGVLIVPADALLSRIDGSYGVQVQAADGTVTWHEVQLLGVSGNKVGIRGDGIAEGTLVLVPA